MSASALPAPPVQWRAAAPFTVSFRLKAVFRLLAVTMAALQAWRGFSVNPDGVSYLDIADAYLRGDWHAAVNTYWSPLYSWLLAAGLAVFRPAPLAEFAVVKVVNFAIFLAALAAFEWFVHEVMASRSPGGATAPGADEGNVALPRWLVVAFAYALFLYSCCVLTSLALVSPDLLVSMFVLLLAAWTLRARRVSPGLVGSLLFGLLLGAACLAKAAMLPLGLLFLGSSLLAVGSVRKAAVHLAAASAVWAVVFGVFVGAMSAKAGRLTLGDVSRLNYIWVINGVRNHGWEADDPRLGTAVHPPRRLSSEPPVFVFEGPAPATFPLWYDPPYWCDGLKWRFDPQQQLAAILKTSKLYCLLFFLTIAPLTAAVALLHFGGWRLSRGTVRVQAAERLRALLAEYPLLVPGLGACAMYAMVHLDDRYLAGFLVLLGVAAVRAVRFAPSRLAVMGRWGGVTAGAIVLAPTVLLALHQGVRAAQVAAGGGARPDWQIAEELQRRGVRAGDPVGYVAVDPFSCGWARAGRYRIMAETRPRDFKAFWAADATRQAEVLDAFRTAGAAAVVAREVPESVVGWERIPGTDYAVRVLGRRTVP